MYETIRKSRSVYGKYFYGNEVSEYGQENGFVDYRTLAKAFDAVMNNSIMQELESAGFYFDPVQDGSSDYNDEIDELREEAEILRREAENMSESAEAAYAAGDEETGRDCEKEAARLEAEADEKDEKADDLESEQDPPEIFQFFIVDDAGSEIIQEWTDDPLFYCSALDMYIWGVTHWGTSWDYVLTDIKINAGEEAWK